MPSNWLGAQITFGTWMDPDSSTTRTVWIRVTTANNTLKKMASRRGQPDMADDILRLNRGRDVLPHPKRRPHHKPPPIPRLSNVYQRLRLGAAIRLPGVLRNGESFSVNAGDRPPTVTAGYAKYSNVEVPGRIGINRFDGYDPLAMDIPIQFENYAAGLGALIERNCDLLERMAGRGDFAGAGFGPPAIIRVSATDNNGNPIPLIPRNWQWSLTRTNAPLFRISNIVWDDNPLRNDNGYRVRQAAVVTVTQYTPLVFVTRSVSRRTMTIPTKKTKHKHKARARR